MGYSRPGCGDLEYQDTGEGAGATRVFSKLTHDPTLRKRCASYLEAWT
jgi:hypothetical protein